MAGSGVVRERWRGSGRVRLEVAPLVGNPGIAQHVADVARGVSAVREAKANPVTGSLLVICDPASPSEGVSREVIARVEGWLGTGTSPPSGAGGLVTSDLARVLSLVGAGPVTRLGPGCTTLLAYSLGTLQNLSFAGIGLVATGGTTALLSRLGAADGASQLKVLGVAAGGFSLVGNWANALRLRTWRGYSQSVEHRLRTAIFACLQEQDLAFFEERGSAQLVALLTADINQIGAFLEGMDGLIESALTITLAGATLFTVSPILGLIAAVTVPAMLLPVRLLRPRAMRAFGEKAASTAALGQVLENVFSGIAEVKSFTAEEVEAERVAALSERIARESVRAAGLPVVQTSLAGNLYYAGYVPALVHASKRVLQGGMPENDLLMATFWYPRLVSAIGRIQDSSSSYFSARAAAARVCRVLDARPSVRSGPIRIDPEEVRGDIVFEGVTFGYDPATPVFHDVSLHVRPGESVGMVGPTGSGKSTLLRLLLRFHDPQAGRILLDGHDLRDLDLRDLRAAIAMVGQDAYLFKGTVRDNIVYGRPGASDEQVRAALTGAGAGELLEALPEGLDTDVGEHGQRLSGGQRQRVAIARAVVKGAAILVLDEATSHLDYATEAAVKTSLQNVSAKRTVLLIAHRLSSVRDADRIIVLEHGVIREKGSHEDLLEQGGLYATLWALQST